MAYQEAQLLSEVDKYAGKELKIFQANIASKDPQSLYDELMAHPQKGEKIDELVFSFLAEALYATVEEGAALVLKAYENNNSHSDNILFYVRKEIKTLLTKGNIYDDFLVIDPGGAKREVTIRNLDLHRYAELFVEALAYIASAASGKTNAKTWPEAKAKLDGLAILPASKEVAFFAEKIADLRQKYKRELEPVLNEESAKPEFALKPDEVAELEKLLKDDHDDLVSEVILNYGLQKVSSYDEGGQLKEAEVLEDVFEGFYKKLKSALALLSTKAQGNPNIYKTYPNLGQNNGQRAADILKAVNQIIDKNQVLKTKDAVDGLDQDVDKWEQAAIKRIRIDNELLAVFVAVLEAQPGDLDLKYGPLLDYAVKEVTRVGDAAQASGIVYARKSGFGSDVEYTAAFKAAQAEKVKNWQSKLATLKGRVAPVPQPPAPKERPKKELGEFADVLDYTLATASNRLFTVDFPGEVNAKKVENAYMEYLGKLKDKGGNFAVIQETLAKAMVLYVDGFLSKGNANHDWVTVRWEEMSAKLKSANATDRFDALRTTPYYEQITQKLLRRMDYYMLLDTSKWKAGGGWNKVGGDLEELLDKCHKELYAKDLAYKAFFKSFPKKGEPTTQFNTDTERWHEADVIEFSKEFAWFIATLTDRRTAWAMVHLGNLKSSFKHDDGQPVDGVADLLNGGYQNKNLDLGDWATMWGAIVEPTDAILNGTYRMSDYLDWLDPDSDENVVCKVQDIYQVGHAERFAKYKKLINNYFNYQFDVKWDKVFKKWKPNKPFLLPPLRSFLEAPLYTQKHVDANLVGDNKIGKRNSENNWANYLKAKDASKKILDLANGAYKTKLTWDHDDSAKNMETIKDVAKEIGTQCAMAYAWRWEWEYQPHSIGYEKPDPVKKTHGKMKTSPLDHPMGIKRHEDQREFLRAFMQFRLVWLLDQLPWDHTNKIPFGFLSDKQFEYDEMMELMEITVMEYVQQNSSFDLWNGYIKEVYEEIVEHNHDFVRKPKIIHGDEERRREYHTVWRQVIQNDGWWKLNFRDQKGLRKAVTYPFNRNSETSAKEKKAG